MVPPRLTLVSRNDDLARDAAREEPEAIEAIELARAISEIETPAQPGAARFAADSPRRDKLRVLEARLFAATEPLDDATLKADIGGDENIAQLLAELQEAYAERGVNLVRVAGKWAFRTAGDLSYLLEKHAVEERRLSRAGLETLAIVAYHQPVTRAEIEDIRGVATSPGTLDILMESGWIRPRGRRRAPGKPLTYGTTDSFLSHFGLESVKDLPGLSDLKAAGLLDGNLPPGFAVPDPRNVAALMPDELPLEADDDEAETQDDGEGFGDDAGAADEAGAAEALDEARPGDSDA